MNIQDALVKLEYKEPDIDQLAILHNFTSDEQKMIKMFWEPAFNGNWIYLSPTMINQDMCYKKISTFYTDTLYTFYVKDIDYKEINKHDELVKMYNKYQQIPNEEISSLGKKVHTGGRVQKYYAITGKTLKKMLMKCGTKKGDQICEYYLKVEQLAIFMKDYIGALHQHILQKQLNDQKQINNEKDQQIQRMSITQNELLTYKKLNSKDESVYIVSTYNYALNGYYKIGRTKNIKNRISNLNTGHVRNDKIRVLAEFKVNDSILLEKTIHSKLRGLLIENEFFMCRYDLLYNLVSKIIENDESCNELINSIIDTVYAMKNNATLKDWMCGIDDNIFNDEMKLISIDDNSKEVVEATFNISNVNIEHRKNFVKSCYEAYRREIEQPQIDAITWSMFKNILQSHLIITNKKKFKSLEWKSYFTEAKNTIVDETSEEIIAV